MSESNELALIAPFLKPLAPLLADPEITEIMVNGLTHRVFIGRCGRIEEIGIELAEANLRMAVRNLARLLAQDVDGDSPILDARLPDGSRVAAVLPPASLGGTTLTIRRFLTRRLDLEALVPPAVAKVLEEAVRERQNLLIAGGADTGKTTLLNALAARIPTTERIVILEDTAEIQLDHPNIVRFEARAPAPGTPPVTLRHLLRATLRHRPDRILLGEVRGGEAFDLLQALNTGHNGMISTIHANSSAQALARFTSCVLESGVELPYTAIRANIADSLELVAYLERRAGRRQLAALARVTRFDAESDRFVLEPLA